MDFSYRDFSIHDKYQLETVFNYPLEPVDGVSEYHVDTYFFVPDNLGIQPGTYTREDFFEDLTRYIRLKTPAMQFEAIADGADSPLVKLEQAMLPLASSPSQTERRFYTDRMKMFCSILKSALRDESNYLRKAAAEPDFPETAGGFAVKVRAILTKFRQLRGHLRKHGVPEADLALFHHADEFISLVTGKYAAQLWDSLEKRFPGRFAEETSALYELVLDERSYRAAMRYPSGEPADPEFANLLYRRATLKKVMASVLFLRSSRRRNGVLLENILFGAAAGVAMMFATGVAFAWKGLFLEEFSLAFFVIWVIAYMGKDRIKELLRGYFQHSLHHLVCDYKTVIATELGHRIGHCMESMTFLPDEKVDPEVMKLRGRSFLTDLENAGYRERIIQYRKKVILNPSLGERIFQDFKVNGLVDIMRFNVHRFLLKMDNPNQTLLIPDPEKKSIVPAKAKRLYHLNIVVRYSMKNRPNIYRRYRVVLSRNGIHAIEFVAQI